MRGSTAAMFTGLNAGRIIVQIGKRDIRGDAER